MGSAFRLDSLCLQNPRVVQTPSEGWLPQSLKPNPTDLLPSRGCLMMPTSTGETFGPLLSNPGQSRGSRMPRATCRGAKRQFASLVIIAAAPLRFSSPKTVGSKQRERCDGSYAPSCKGLGGIYMYWLGCALPTPP